MRPPGNDLGSHECPGCGVPLQQSEHAQLERRSHLWEPPRLRQAPAQLHEVVDGLLHGIADEVLDDVAHVFEMTPTAAMQASPIVAVGDPARGMQHPRKLELLGHVIEEMPPQIASVVVRRRRWRDAEDPGLDAIHEVAAGMTSSVTRRR